jgi:ABC-type Na+ transport system ATPase subunit NatA
MIEHLENKIMITIKDELTINNSAKIYSDFAKALLVDGNILISIPSPIPLDITFLQILHAFLSKCKSVNKNVSFEVTGYNELKMALIYMGYYDIARFLETSENKVEG